MFGMFIILPVFALYARDAARRRDHTLVGIALGAYGLTQALLQVPFGYASDRWGRKPAITSGCSIFAVGSFVAAWAPDIAWTIVGRWLQGAGAISAAVHGAHRRPHARRGAHAGDGRDRHDDRRDVRRVARRRARAQQAIGVPGIFALTGVLALAAIARRTLRGTAPARAARTARRRRAQLARVACATRSSLRLNYGIFALHAVLMALFMQVPFALRDAGLAARAALAGLPAGARGVGRCLLPLPAPRRPAGARQVDLQRCGVAMLAVASWCWLALSLHSLVRWRRLPCSSPRSTCSRRRCPRWCRSSRRPPRGTAIGVYSSVQFFGVFVGAAVGGLLAQHAGAAAVFGFGAGADAGLARRERDDGRAAARYAFHLFDRRNLMASVNKVILLGNLGRDPETRYTTGGDAVTNLNIATSEQWKDKSGEKQERTEWHRVVLFGRQAEIAGEYLKKGRSVYIEGRLQTRKYTDKDGVEKYSTEIVGDRHDVVHRRSVAGRRLADPGLTDLRRNCIPAKVRTCWNTVFAMTSPHNPEIPICSSAPTTWRRWVTAPRSCSNRGPRRRMQPTIGRTPAVVVCRPIDAAAFNGTVSSNGSMSAAVSTRRPSG